LESGRPSGWGLTEIVVATAWELHRRLPRSSLIVVDGAGHEANNPGITEALVRATDSFAKHRE
jgi:hypothetical protein